MKMFFFFLEKKLSMFQLVYVHGVVINNAINLLLSRYIIGALKILYKRNSIERKVVLPNIKCMHLTSTKHELLLIYY